MRASDQMTGRVFPRPAGTWPATPPAPETFKLDPERIGLAVITEFFDTTPPTRQWLDPGTSADAVDQSSIWGEMRTVPGRAFAAGAHYLAPGGPFFNKGIGRASTRLCSPS
jgi:hypothetical protein